MKGLRILILSLMGLFIAFFIVSALLPAKYRVEREILVEAPVERVYGLIANFKEWSSWHPMYRTEPLAEYLYAGAVQEPGALLSWTGQDIGKGNITLIEANQPFSLKTEMIIEAPASDRIWLEWELEEQNDLSTKVRWAKAGSLSYPFERWVGLMMDSELGPEMEQGLQQLKVVAELRPHEPTKEPLDPFPDTPPLND